jgi:hypothetical protein
MTASRALVVAAIAIAACKRAPTTGANDAAPLPPPGGGAAAGASAASGVPAQLGGGVYGQATDAEPFLPAAPVTSQTIDLSHTEIVQVAPSAPPPPPPPDPFAAPTESVRRSALGCFVGQPAGEYAATITIVVSAGGTPSRVEVSPGNVDDQAVISCLKQAGEAGRFPVSSGRSVSVEVRVKG